jgi:hypothetical protein
MNKFIVTTTINPPTEALKKFNAMNDWHLIVVGDLKTPHDLYEDYDYLHPDLQKRMYPELSEAIGWNCIQRRNIGTLEAYNMGADIVALVDDDNIPYKNWGKEIYIGAESNYKTVCSDDLCVDPLSECFANSKVPPHRGFPFELDTTRQNLYTKRNKISICDIQANMWDGDPDIDAVSRLIFKEKVSFPYFSPFKCDQFSPFNSQNTIISRKVIPNYFLFPFIGRMDDIWASYYVEALGFKPLYCPATVYQERNAHDINVDIQNESWSIHTLNLLEELDKDSENIKKFLPKPSFNAFQIYKGMFK